MSDGTRTCYRHPDRRAGVTCQRCARPICPSCMIQASVGFQCPQCAHGGSRNVRTMRSIGSRPVVTIALIAVNVAVFVADIVSAGATSLWGAGGRGGLSTKWLLVGAASDGAHPVGVAFGEWWRIITGGFLHAGLIHLAMNMLVLWLLGSQIEAAIGRTRFAALYFTSLVAGAFGVLLMAPTDPTVGASGAIFGLMGAVFALQRSRGIDPWRSGLGGLLILNLVITFAIPGISIGGHLGGLVGGLVAGLVMFQVDRKTSSVWPALAACAVLTVVLWIGCLWAASRWATPLFG